MKTRRIAASVGIVLLAALTSIVNAQVDGLAAEGGASQPRRLPRVDSSVDSDPSAPPAARISKVMGRLRRTWPAPVAAFVSATADFAGRTVNEGRLRLEVLDRFAEQDSSTRQGEHVRNSAEPPFTNEHATTAAICDVCGLDRTKCTCMPENACTLLGLDPAHCPDCFDGFAWTMGAWRVAPFGALRGETIYSGSDTTGDAAIAFVNPVTPDVGDARYTVTARTSLLGLHVFGPSVGGYQIGGTVLTSFLGPQPFRENSAPFVMNAYGELRNEDWRLAIGRMDDLFSPISPNTVNFLQQRGAGNVGAYRGALRVDRYLAPSYNVRWILSSAISQLDVNDFQTIPSVRGTDDGRPNVETRVGLALGADSHGVTPFELGFSGLIGRTRGVENTPVIGDIVFAPSAAAYDTWGVNVDMQYHRQIMGVRGEVWVGQAAGTYFMGVLQSINPQGLLAVRSVGGWGEWYCQVTPRATIHLGYGVDDPQNDQLGFVFNPAGPGQITRNEVTWANAVWNVTKSIELAFEVSYRETSYLRTDSSNSAVLYHFRSALVF